MSADESTDTYPTGRSPSVRQVMMPRDTNAFGTIFGGVILAQIDLAAAVEAHRHWPARLVTVAMDQIEFKQPVWVGDLVSFFTETTRIGNTSITVQVDVWAERRFGREGKAHVTVASVTMVAVDDDFRPAKIERPASGTREG